MTSILLTELVWILDTDYTTYSILYSCVEAFYTVPLEFAWIQSRNASFADNPLHEKILARAFALGIPNRFVQTPQKGCW